MMYSNDYTTLMLEKCSGKRFIYYAILNLKTQLLAITDISKSIQNKDITASVFCLAVH